VVPKGFQRPCAPARHDATENLGRLLHGGRSWRWHRRCARAASRERSRALSASDHVRLREFLANHLGQAGEIGDDFIERDARPLGRARAGEEFDRRAAPVPLEAPEGIEDPGVSGRRRDTRSASAPRRARGGRSRRGSRHRSSSRRGRSRPPECGQGPQGHRARVCLPP
jgi:hypothetical protein